VPEPAPAPPPAPPPSPGTGGPPPAPFPIATIDLEGDVSHLSGACPLLTFRVGIATIATTPETRYKKKTSCHDVREGRRVEVKAQIMSDASLRAQEIEIDKRRD
jgi:hypothetical protein